MKVILLQNVKNVGQKGDVKEVSEGFAHNHLFPRKLAKPGTQQNLNEITKLSQDKTKHEEAVLSKIEDNFVSLSNESFSFQMNANNQGALFAKFEEKNLVDFLHSKGFKFIELKHVSIVGSPIKHLGAYQVILQEGKLQSTFNIVIESTK